MGHFGIKSEQSSIFGTHSVFLFGKTLQQKSSSMQFLKAHCHPECIAGILRSWKLSFGI